MEIKLLPLDLTRPYALVAFQKFLWRQYAVWLDTSGNVPMINDRGVHFFDDKISIPMMQVNQYGSNDFFVVVKRVDELTVDIVGFTFASMVFHKGKKAGDLIKGLKTKVVGGNLEFNDLNYQWNVVGENKPIQQTLGFN